MTRYFRSIAALLLGGHLLVLWMAVLTEPRTFYWHVMSLTAHPEEIAWAALAVTLWHAMDSGLLPNNNDFYSSIKSVKDANPKPTTKGS